MTDATSTNLGRDAAAPSLQPAILIAGPTASGKSALAMRLAARLDGTVINADSMQVYRDLRVLSARPTPAEALAVPHRLFGHVDGAVNFSVGKWLADAAAALDEARRAGRRPILVGGTGLYFKALTQGLSDIPVVPEGVRIKVREAAAGLPPEALHARLAACDPATARRLRPTDPQRILRALEVFEAAGRPLVAFQGARTPPLLAAGQYAGFFLAPERPVLSEVIDRRFAAMVANGALEEATALAARRLDPALPVMRAHGIPALLAHLRGELGLDEAIDAGQRDTRRYAKRQFTFARHQLTDFRWIAPEAAEAAVLDTLLSAVRPSPDRPASRQEPVPVWSAPSGGQPGRS